MTAVEVFAGVPVEVGEVAEAAGEVVVAVEECAEDLKGFGDELDWALGDWGKESLRRGRRG